MGILDTWFRNPEEEGISSHIKFGRFTDSYKKDEQYEAWQNALDKFDDGDHFGALEDFFFYLRDEAEENVSYARKGEESFTFELYQGSQKIEGFANKDKFRAETKVAKVASVHIGFMRRLLEKNFTLQYSRFALDESNNIVVIFDTHLLDSSPQKLYHALNEMATNADKMDDVLVSEFEDLEWLRGDHITDISEKEKEIKYTFFQETLEKSINQISKGKLDGNLYPQAIGYVLLDTIYKLDYLIKPEGYTMETIERINRKYFTENHRSVIEKNNMFYKELLKLQRRTKAAFFKELYGTKSTFGVTQVVNHDKLKDFIQGVIKDYDWYANHKHVDIAKAMTGYVVGYILFYWAPPKPCRELLHLYYEVMEYGFFAKLGSDDEYCRGKRVNRGNVRKRISEIIKDNKEHFYELEVETSLLDCSTMHDFGRTFLEMILSMKIDPKPIG